MKAGARVKMSASFKTKMQEADMQAHVDEFGRCTSVVLGLTAYDPDHLGPEVDVRWLPSNLKYAYSPDDLVNA